MNQEPGDERVLVRGCCLLGWSCHLGSWNSSVLLSLPLCQQTRRSWRHRDNLCTLNHSSGSGHGFGTGCVCPGSVLALSHVPLRSGPPPKGPRCLFRFIWSREGQTGSHLDVGGGMKIHLGTFPLLLSPSRLPGTSIQTG